MENLRQGVDMPAWYKLDANQGIIDINVHKKAAIGTNIFNLDDLAKTQQYLHLPNEFIVPSSDHEWGFGPILAQVETDDKDWIDYKCQLPKPTGTKEIDWDNLYSVSATLQVLFHYLSRYQTERLTTGSNTPQMQLVELWSRKRGEPYGGGLTVEVLPALCKWINANINNELQARSMKKSMIESYRQMAGKVHFFEDISFRVSLQPTKSIHLDVPGESCGLDSAYSTGNNLDRSYRLVPHNTDTPLQQLSLLSGVAKMDKLASVNYS